jgi:putative Holliday junction resolvase
MPEAAETILGFDFGEKRIGVAVGNTVTSLASPLTTLHVESNRQRLEAVQKLVQDWQPARFVIGQPAHDDGRPHEIAHLAQKFGNRLFENFRLPVEYINETLSSDEASRQLKIAGITGIAQKEHLDAAAAQVILQSYLDQRSPHAA